MTKGAVISLIVAVVAVLIWVTFRNAKESIAPVLTPTPTLTPIISLLPPTPTTPAPTSIPTLSQQSNTVIYTDSGYSPATLTIKRGQTVIWQNNSSSGMRTASAVHPTHRIYSGTDIAACGAQTLIPMFDACEGITSGHSWSFKFDNVGTWNYHNHSHPSHTGTIVVE